MRTSNVSFFAPATLEEILQLLGEHGEKACLLAGGTDLVREINLNLRTPGMVVWIQPACREYIHEQDGRIHIGTATLMQTAAASDLLKRKARSITQAAGRLASPSVRALATLGGNVCTASPAADAVCALLGLGAELLLVSARGSRVVPLADFFLGPGKTLRQPDELLVEMQVRPTVKGEGSAYAKIGRRQAMTLAVLNTACRVKLDGKGNCTAVVIAIGAAAPTPMRATQAEKVLLGNPFTDESIREAAETAAREIKPIDDVHGTAWYRRKMTRVLVARTLHEAGGLQEGAVV